MFTDSRTTQIARAADMFYLDRQAQGCASATLAWYRRHVGRLVAWLLKQQVSTVEGITSELLRLYLVDLQGLGYAPKTVHHYAAAARVFCKWLLYEGLLDADLFKRVKMPKVPKQVLPALTAEEVKTLLDSCEHARDKALLLFMLDTGTRAAETVAVNVGDVDTQTGAVTIVRGKGQKGRVVFLGVQARKALLRYLLTRADISPAAPLWVSHKGGKRLTIWGLSLLCKRLSGRSGVHVHPHKLRRSCGIWSLRAGMDIARLADMLGHADLQTVQLYLEIVEGDLEDAHSVFGAVDALLGKGRRRR